MKKLVPRHGGEGCRFGRGLAICAAAFGIMHGSMWLPAMLAGMAYGAIAINTGRIGEAVVAHATTNALIAAAVLLFDQWQLW
jgi:membrane protease YdiL (CAAX protease family)